MPTTEHWKAPKTAQETYKYLGDNAITAINRDAAGARTQRDLPKGNKEYQLYSLNTPNGQKVGITLEELGLDYDEHVIDIMKGEQFTSGFVEININSKIPVLCYEPKQGGQPALNVFESGAILLYLAEKYDMLIPPQGSPQRAECYSWLMWQMSAQGPMFGQFWHFMKYAPRNKVDVINYGVARYSMEMRRLLSVMENHLKQDGGRTWWLGNEYTIADIICFPWTEAVTKLDMDEFLGLKDFPSVLTWCERMRERPAVQRGVKVCTPA